MTESISRSNFLSMNDQKFLFRNKQHKGRNLDDTWLGPNMIHCQLGKEIHELANKKEERS